MQNITASEENINTLKIIIIGDSHVGKSSLIRSLIDDKFTSDGVTTVGVDFKIDKYITADGKSYQIGIWDTAGQERYRSAVQFSSRGSDGALVCFDLSDESTINSVDVWLKYLSNHCPEDLLVYLVGTKCDIRKKITEEQIKELNSRHNLKYTFNKNIRYFETSSKTKQGVTEMFHSLYDECIEKREASQVRQKRTISKQQVIHRSYLKQSLKLSEFKSTPQASGIKSTEIKGGCC